MFAYGKAETVNDSIVFKNGNLMVGEIKSMDRGVLIFKTDYSDKDFNIEWKGIKEIYSDNFFLISVSDGFRYNGSFYSVDTSGTILIASEEGPVQRKLDDIVYIKSLDKDFWSRVSASIDVGLNITKANNLRQFDTRANIGYLACQYWFDVKLSQVWIQRYKVTDGSAFPREWPLV